MVLSSRAKNSYLSLLNLFWQFSKTSAKEREDLLTGLEHYYDPNDYNKTFYYNDSTATDNQINRILMDADKRLAYGGFSSPMLQSPTDPDATFREKAGKKYRGYVANLEESVGENGSVITDYQFEQNTYSDSQFLQESLHKTKVQEEASILITDGAYCGAENTALAESKIYSW